MRFVIEAMRRVASLPKNAKPDASDIGLIKPYAIKGYFVDIQGVKTRATAKRKRKIFRYRIEPKDSEMTLLQHAASHVLWLAKVPSKNDWIKQCPCKIESGRSGKSRICGRFFTVYDPKTKYCNGSYCINNRPPKDDEPNEGF
jgi:hypothetical protein